MFLSEWHEFPSAPCLAGKETWWQLASRCCWNCARPWHASELVSFLAGLRIYQNPGKSDCDLSKTDIHMNYVCIMYMYVRVCMCIYIYIYRVSQEECVRLREGVPYVKVYRYNPKHLCPKLNGYGDNDQRSLKLWQLLHTYWLPNTY